MSLELAAVMLRARTCLTSDTFNNPSLLLLSTGSTVNTVGFDPINDSALAKLTSQLERRRITPQPRRCPC